MILIIFLGVIFGVFIFLGLLYVILRNKIKTWLGSFGYSESMLKEETEFYNKVETSLMLIFSSLENKEVKVNDDLILVRDKLKEQIEDLKNSKMSVKYSDVKFHRHALRYYTNKDGVLNISVSTSLEYYYTKECDGRVIKEYKDYKKQTRYITEFIYIYNPDKVMKNQSLIGINCPNCGAPVKDLGHKKCRYCGSGLEDINLKSWHISLFKEEY